MSDPTAARHGGAGRRPCRVVVVGGGMAGLGAARVLEAARAQDPSLDWRLFEQDPRFGGKGAPTIRVAEMTIGGR